MITPPENRLTLAIDTSSALGSIALGRGPEMLGMASFEADRGHSKRLLPAIDELFRQARTRIEDVALFAVIVGPGSFTGLRVSLASVRGLSGPKPCFGALATDATAWAGRGRGAMVLALTDLFHGEVFGCVHGEDGALVSSHESGPVTSVLNSLRDWLSGPVLAMGPCARKHQSEIEAVCPTAVFEDLVGGLAPPLLSLSNARASEETICPAGDLLPYYLRDPLTRGLLNARPGTPT